MGLRRERFTLGHEPGHLIFGHGEYLRAESVDAQDIEDSERPDLGKTEFDALRAGKPLRVMSAPTARRVRRKCKHESAGDGLWDKGFGLVFLDHQPVNVRSFNELTFALAAAYEVSRSAVSIRLRGLGLLCDPQTQVRQGQDRGPALTA